MLYTPPVFLLDFSLTSLQFLYLFTLHDLTLTKKGLIKAKFGYTKYKGEESLQCKMLLGGKELKIASYRYQGLQ